MENKKNTFKKEERLCSKKHLEMLFHKGSSFLLYPYRVTWILTPDVNQTFPAQVVISVSKKKFKSSVDRNSIKRYIRECYRLNKAQFLYNHLGNTKVLLNINYIGNQIHDFEFLSAKTKAMLRLLIKQVGDANI